ncbi:hypothetical protein Tco_1144486 [Tanacetum coccineum]
MDVKMDFLNGPLKEELREPDADHAGQQKQSTWRYPQVVLKFFGREHSLRIMDLTTTKYHCTVTLSQPSPSRVIQCSTPAPNILLYAITLSRNRQSDSFPGADNRPPMLEKDAIQVDFDVKATNIILQGLPPEVYALVSNHRIVKELWERIQLLMQGTSLTKQERECNTNYGIDNVLLIIRGDTT